MSIRRINQTGRQRIGRDSVRVSVQPDTDGGICFQATLDLTPYEFPATAAIYVEAYRQHSYERFALGSIADPVADAPKRLALFREGDQVQFRIKVVDTTNLEGCLLGEADRLRPDAGDKEDGARLSLLPTEGRDLGEEAWRLEIEDGPLLLVSNRLGDWKQLARSAAFVWLVYPAVLREVLRYILVRLDHRSTDDLTDWKDQWLLASQGFLRAEGIPGPNAEEEEVDEWITDVVAGFCRKHRLLERFGRATFSGEDA